MDDGTIAGAIELIKTMSDKSLAQLAAHDVNTDGMTFSNLLAGIAAFKPYISEDFLPVEGSVAPPIMAPRAGLDPYLISPMQQVYSQLRKWNFIAETSRQLLQKLYGGESVNVGNKSAKFYQTGDRIEIMQIKQKGDEYPEGLLPIQRISNANMSLLISMPADEKEFDLTIMGGSWDVWVSGMGNSFIPYIMRAAGGSGYTHEEFVEYAGGFHLKIPKKYGTIVDDTCQIWLHLSFEPDTGQAAPGYVIVYDFQLLDSDKSLIMAAIHNYDNCKAYRNLFTRSTRYLELTASKNHDQYADGSGFALLYGIEVVKVKGGKITFERGFTAKGCLRLRYIENIVLGHDNVPYAFFDCISLTQENCKVEIDDQAFVSSNVFYNSGFNGTYNVPFYFSCFLNYTNVEKLVLNQGLATKDLKGYADIAINMPMLKSIEASPLDLSAVDRDAFRDCMMLRKLPAIKSGKYKMQGFLRNCISLESVDFAGLESDEYSYEAALLNCISLKSATNVPVVFLKNTSTSKTGFESLYSLEELTFSSGQTLRSGSLDLTHTQLFGGKLVACLRSLPACELRSDIRIEKRHQDSIADVDLTTILPLNWRVIVDTTIAL